MRGRQSVVEVLSLGALASGSLWLAGPVGLLIATAGVGVGAALVVFRQ